MTVETRQITFAASDGWQLVGDLFTGPNPKTAIFISAGTGFPRRFYADLARYLAEQGAIVLTYDYRGMGDSRGPDPEWFDIDYPDWGRYDMPAALDALRAHARGLPIMHVGHSVGGHFLGLMSNHDQIERHAFVSVGTGYMGGHHKSYWPAEMFFWWGLGVYNLARHGYIRPGGGWTGEPLPPKLFRTWRRWCHKSAYFRSDLDGLMAPQHYDAVTAPIRSWIFDDDPIATARTAPSLLGCYPNAPSEIVYRSAADYGLRRIGHEGAMRKGREALWAEIWDWLDPAQSNT